jgi:hypothetical protein
MPVEGDTQAEPGDSQKAGSLKMPVGVRNWLRIADERMKRIRLP